jgi:para-aminobenzoate synthetase/4-amino-4-deoxychorismate lyase
MNRPAILFDNAADEHLEVFAVPRQVIRADQADEVANALQALESARRAGNFVAGYCSYELGYALETRLRPLMPAGRRVPLLWFGVFEAPQILQGDAIRTAFDGWIQGRAYAGPLHHEWDWGAYRPRVQRVKDLIAAGDFYQANLTFRSGFAFAGDALALYRRLRSQSLARYGAFVDDGERQVLSLSPELFFQISDDGHIAAKPMKGTAARGPDGISDTLAREALAESTKNRAENLMIVDLLRNDLGRVAELGSVAVSDLFAVETYPTLHQMVSTVSAKLKPETDVAALLGALFPCGSVTGAPKIHATELIAELEQGPRGIYCGAIGWFGPDGAARFNVAIRTATIWGNRGELGIGGGIIADSDPAGEYDEALLKARYFAACHRPLELIETLRWSPEDGFTRLDLHMSRMARSAAVFGIPFDTGRAIEAMRDALPPACGEVDVRSASGQRVRLTLNEAGEFACTSAPLGKPKACWSYVVSHQRVSSTDLLARHKTNWRELYDSEYSRLSSRADEVIFLNERDEIVEGSRTNIFVKRDGVLLTPPLSAGALDGILRRHLICEGQCLEAALTADDLRGAEVYLDNSLRGLIPAVAC